MLALTRGINQKLFNFHTNSITRPVLAMATITNIARVSSPQAFSTGSPNHESVKRVGTHNGSFHCDEALGCFMIRLTDKFFNAEIVRTRDPQVTSLFSFFLRMYSRKVQEEIKGRLYSVLVLEQLSIVSKLLHLLKRTEVPCKWNHLLVFIFWILIILVMHVLIHIFPWIS